MPRQIQTPSEVAEVLIGLITRGGVRRLSPEAERALAESSRFRGPVAYSDYADAIRYQITETPLLNREALARARERLIRLTHVEASHPWKMVGYDRNGVVTAECYRGPPTRYEAYYIDPAESLSTGTVCYTPDSKQPMNGDPREEFETWALKELAKGIRVEKWPLF